MSFLDWLRLTHLRKWVLVPGLPNQLAAAWAQVNPRWVVRTVTGFATRQTDWMKAKRSASPRKAE